MKQPVEKMESISQEECNAICGDVAIDLKHTSKEDLVKMLTDQVKTNSSLKNEINAQNTAITQLRANAVKPGNVQVSAISLALAHKECLKVSTALAQVALDRVNGNEKQERILFSQLCNNRVIDIIANTGAIEMNSSKAETTQDKA